MVNPSVPELKQVNLYQKELSVVTGTLLHTFDARLVPVQVTTVVCVKTCVPQTGIAVAGVIPGRLQGCACSITLTIIAITSRSEYFLINKCISMYLYILSPGWVVGTKPA
jgi:hypothetical protein